MQLPAPQRRPVQFDVAPTQQQQHPLQQHQAASAAVAAQTYPPSRQPSLPQPPGTSSTGGPFQQHPQFDAYPQSFHQHGSVSPSARSSGFSPYTSASLMPRTPTSMEQPMVNPWLLPFALSDMGVIPLPDSQFWFGKARSVRQRTNQACEKCRDRKTKCTGERPSCMRCSQRGYICEYASDRRVRRPAKNHTRAAASIDQTASTPISPTSSLSDKKGDTDGIADTSLIPSTGVMGEEHQSNKLVGIAEGAPPVNLFQDWLQQSNSSPGVSTNSSDAVTPDECANGLTGPAFPEMSANVRPRQPHAAPPSPSVRYSHSMPQLHLPYDIFEHSVPLAPTLPFHAGMRQVSVVADTHADCSDDVVWALPPFDQAQLLQFRDELSGHSHGSGFVAADGQQRLYKFAPPLAHPQARTPDAAPAPHGQSARNFTQPSPVLNPKGYGITQSRTPPLVHLTAGDGDAQGAFCGSSWPKSLSADL